MKQAVLDIVDFVRLRKLYCKYRKFTMIAERDYIENLLLVKRALSDITLQSGAVVECGTWKGGMSAALVDIGGPSRNYYFFDSFEGMPPAKEVDGIDAMAWQADTSGAGYHDNCSASLADIKEALSMSIHRNASIDIRKGFFEQSFPAFNPPPIAVLRLDADWYDATMLCLQKFWQHVMSGGIILIDDYYDWDACSRAVHDFMSSVKAPERIQQGRFAGVAFIKKT